MKLYIKNMVCPAFKYFVRREAEKLGLKIKSVGMGEVEIVGVISDNQQKQLDNILKQYGLGLADTHENNLITRIKVAVNNLQNHSLAEFKEKLPSYIRRNLNYASLNEAFLSEVGCSIDDYFNNIKIERAIELLELYHLEMTEAAFQLGYFDSSELANQLGKTPPTVKSRKNMQPAYV